MSRPKYQTPEAVDEREAWRGTQTHCWLCMLLGRDQWHAIEVHEIIERGKAAQPYVAHNFAALCGFRDRNCHKRLQSRGERGRVICWALKAIYDADNLDIEKSVAMLGNGKGNWRAYYGDAMELANRFVVITEGLKL
jgi:mannose-6-phosphate isomerase class I